VPPPLRPDRASLEVVSPEFGVIPDNGNGFYSAHKKPSIGSRSSAIELENPLQRAALA
jgi:hypothetical protein